MPTMTQPSTGEQTCTLVTGGVDTHQDTHTAVALDQTGRLLGHRPEFFMGVAGEGLNYNLVISIMFACSWVGSWSDCRVGAPGSTLRPGSFHDRRDGWGGGQVGAGMALIACQVLITSVVQGQSARRCSQRLRCPRVSRAGSCHSR